MLSQLASHSNTLSFFKRMTLLLILLLFLPAHVQAGPPYEDIAFRIVRKEWNYARKHGFRCSFERGILHLFFNFKRARYRR